VTVLVLRARDIRLGAKPGYEDHPSLDRRRPERERLVLPGLRIEDLDCEIR
jgi:hypothetical protein